MQYHVYISDGFDSHGFYTVKTLEEAKILIERKQPKYYEVVYGIEVDIHE